MATWVTSGYRNGRGAEITFTYTAEYQASTNQTKIVLTGYSVKYNTGNQTGPCEIEGTFTVASADTPTSSHSYTVSQDYNGNGITKETAWSYTFYVNHDLTEDKSIVLSFVGDVNANYYKPSIDDSTTVHIATAQLGLVYINNGTAFEAYEVYIDNGSSWDKYLPYIDNGSSWDICS